MEIRLDKKNQNQQMIMIYKLKKLGTNLKVGFSLERAVALDLLLFVYRVYQHLQLVKTKIRLKILNQLKLN